MSYVELWARAFLLTLSSELCVAPFLLPKGEPRLRRFGAVAAANVLSHPAVWFVFPELGLRYTPMLVLAELWAFGSEVLLYRLVFRELPLRRAIAASAFANATSLLLGIVLRELGVPL